MKKPIISCFFLLLLQLIFLSLILSGCVIFDDDRSLSHQHTFRFSIKNDTISDLKIELNVGLIPSVTAKYTDFSEIPDEIYRLAESSSDEGASCAIKTKKHDKVFNNAPIAYLGMPSALGENEDYAKIREALLNKLVSFIITIKSDSITYRIAGWDLPDEDMKAHEVDKKFYGYYDTAEEKYTEYTPGAIFVFPRLYSNLFHREDWFPDDWDGGHNPSSLCYFLKVNNSGILWEDIDTNSSLANLNDYWRNH